MCGMLALVLSCKSGQKEGSFRIHADFKIELVASKPEVLDLVDLEFDQYGSVYVIEMPGYPLSEEEGRIILLEDTDGDGVFDKRNVFEED
jgi:hypothetical protein